MTKRPLNRRDFLKILVASGAGLTVSSAVPSSWMKPFVKTGVLPVHAASSIPSNVFIYAFDDGTSGTADPTFLISKIQCRVTTEYWDPDPSLPPVAGIPNAPVKLTIENKTGGVGAYITDPTGTLNTDADGYVDFGDFEFNMTLPFSLDLLFSSYGTEFTLTYTRNNFK